MICGTQELPRAYAMVEEVPFKVFETRRFGVGQGRFHLGIYAAVWLSEFDLSGVRSGLARHCAV